MVRKDKTRLIAAPQLIDRGTWVRLDQNPEPFTRENATKQLSENPLYYLKLEELRKKCEFWNLNPKITEWNSGFVKDVFDGKKERFWSHIADNYLGKYFTEVEKNIKEVLNQNRCFLAIGGSHSIALPISKAIFNHHNSIRDKLSIVFFDDHEDDYGKKMDKIRPSMYHGSWAEVVRREFNYSPFWIKPENFDSGKLASELKGKKFLYLSIDIDVFEKEITPSTFYARFDEIFSTGTMNYDLWQKYLNEIKKIADENYVKILGADISEFIPYGHTAEDNKKTAEHIARLLNDLYHLIV